MGLIILFYYCIPLNRYRTIVFSGMALLALGAIFILPILEIHILGYEVYSMNYMEIIVLICSLVISSIIFFIGIKLSKKILKKYEKTN